MDHEDRHGENVEEGPPESLSESEELFESGC